MTKELGFLALRILLLSPVMMMLQRNGWKTWEAAVFVVCFASYIHIAEIS